MSRRLRTAALLAGLASASAWAAADPVVERGRLLFTRQASPPCAACHTLLDAGAQGVVGPDLDELRPDTARVARAVSQGLGNMPAFRGTLGPEDIAAVARYVSQAAGR